MAVPRRNHSHDWAWRYFRRWSSFIFPKLHSTQTLSSRGRARGGVTREWGVWSRAQIWDTSFRKLSCSDQADQHHPARGQGAGKTGIQIYRTTLVIATFITFHSHSSRSSLQRKCQRFNWHVFILIFNDISWPPCNDGTVGGQGHGYYIPYPAWSGWPHCQYQRERLEAGGGEWLERPNLDSAGNYPRLCHNLNLYIFGGSGSEKSANNEPNVSGISTNRPASPII